MQITLVVPELVWPEPDDHEAFAGLTCPGLLTLIARSRLTRRPRQSVEATLADLFGLTANPPYAALRLSGESASPTGAPACWLCADPVHLRLHQERLVLADGAGLGIALDEARTLIDELNRHFVDVGRFQAATSDRWYLQLAAGSALAQLDVLPLSAVAGRRVDRQLPETPELRWLRRLLNEVQMVLHRHPANEMRAAAGQSTINSLWFWGAGWLPERIDGKFSTVWGGDVLARGLGRAAQAAVQALPEDAGGLLRAVDRRGRHLLVLDALQRPVHYQDGAVYRRRLQALDRLWFAPLQKALATGRIAQLRLLASTVYGVLDWRSGTAGQWQLWQQPGSLQGTAVDLAGGRE